MFSGECPSGAWGGEKKGQGKSNKPHDLSRKSHRLARVASVVSRCVRDVSQVAPTDLRIDLDL